MNRMKVLVLCMSLLSFGAGSVGAIVIDGEAIRPVTTYSIIARDPEMAVIMMTGLDMPEVAIECIDQGARTYLVKPVEVEFLRLALRDALAMRRVLVERNDFALRSASLTGVSALGA